MKLGTDLFAVDSGTLEYIDMVIAILASGQIEGVLVLADRLNASRFNPKLLQFTV